MLYDCSGWEVGVEWEVPEGVVSGVFVGRVVREDGGGVERETWRVDGSKVGKDVRFGMDGEVGFFFFFSSFLSLSTNLSPPPPSLFFFSSKNQRLPPMHMGPLGMVH